MALKRLFSDRLKGLETDHSDCRYAAPSHGTGVLELMMEGADETKPGDWVMEFYCSLCKQNYFSCEIEFHDRIREALIENGIIPASDKVGPSY
jgi:hypothetical protein